MFFHRLQTQECQRQSLSWLYWTLKVKTHTATPHSSPARAWEEISSRKTEKTDVILEKSQSGNGFLDGLLSSEECPASQLTFKQCTSHILFPQHKSPLTARHVSSPWTPVLLFTHALTLSVFIQKLKTSVKERHQGPLSGDPLSVRSHFSPTHTHANLIITATIILQLRHFFNSAQILTRRKSQTALLGPPQAAELDWRSLERRRGFQYMHTHCIPCSR